MIGRLSIVCNLYVSGTLMTYYLQPENQSGLLQLHAQIEYSNATDCITFEMHKLIWQILKHQQNLKIAQPLAILATVIINSDCFAQNENR